MAFKFSGRIEQDSLLHSIKEEAPDGALIPPKYVKTTWGNVPQYAATIRDTHSGYDPAGDCSGYFMSYKYQPNNNCYAYACNIASNSFAQPGRLSGAPTLHTNFTAEHVKNNALSDGLLLVGTSNSELKQHVSQGMAGHYVALMFSSPESNIGGDSRANWPGDYHWARCDDLATMSWSQKDGGDQVTDFDFAGKPISDPSSANWRVNQGPVSQVDPNEYVVSYDFAYYMFVPDGQVNII